MYSYEDLIRAVRLYIKLGKRTTATIQQLSYERFILFACTSYRSTGRSSNFLRMSFNKSYMRTAINNLIKSACLVAPVLRNMDLN
jgi:hypothetical protein